LIQQFSLDRLNNVNSRTAGSAAIAAFNGLQNFEPEQQAAGLAVMIEMLRRRYGFSVSSVMAVASNLVDRVGHEEPNLRAMKLYVENEL
jgi:hypothetical protein